MLRNIIEIDAAKCNGCGLCASACHEGTIGIVDGKARLLRDDYCDGLGNCLPACPQEAITMVQREAPAFDQEAVETGSRLNQWPVQLRLTPVRAACFQGAHLLIAADCTAYTRGDFHQRFLSGRVTLIGCPKLDQVDYAAKLAAILSENDIRDICLVRMEVPCCGGMEFAIRRALEQSGKQIPLHITVLSTNGKIIQEGE